MPTTTGTSGDDTLTGTDDPDTIYGGGGNDIIHAGASGSIDDHIEDGAGNDVVHGGPDADYIICSPGNDLYDGGTGATTFGVDYDTVDYSTALAGINIDMTRTDYQVWSTGAGDAANIGHDQLQNIEAIVGTQFDDTMMGGTTGITFDGGDGNDTLKGGDGNDYLDGGNGNDVIDGGAGEDMVFYGDAGSGVHVSLAVKTAQDTGQGFDTLTNIEDVYGSSFSDVLIGNSGNNVLAGGIGGNDRLYGGAGSDELVGSAYGTNYLDGGTGADLMIGGLGSDTYIVDNPGDQVTDQGDDGGSTRYGTDTVRASITYSLGFDIENLVLTGSTSTSGTGNALDNKITGNSGVNKLYGMGGNDTLDGKGGTDSMVGGTGDDRYYVDSYGDHVIENAGEGTDSVFASASYKLGANIEKLTLTGSADIFGYANDLDNALTGNAGANKLYGMAGNDTIKGGAGNDWIEGGAGKDVVYGGTGSDSFVFRDGDFGGATAATADRIMDFSQGEDMIRLNYVDADTGITGDQAFHFIGTATFDGTAGELRYQEIAGATYVSGDTNGDGHADFMIRIDGLHALTSHDFVL